MNRKTKNKMFTLNTSLRGHAIGTRLNLEVDNKGVVKDRYWRERIKDAETDNCIQETKQDSKIKKVKTDAE